MKLLIIALVALVVLSCDSEENDIVEKPVEITQKTEGTFLLDVREWGVFVCEGEKAFSEIKNSSTESSTLIKPRVNRVQVREPVIYFDAAGIDSLDVSVTIISGEPDLTYPYARLVDSTATWSVTFEDSMTLDDSLKPCLKENMRILNDVAATPLVVNGIGARSLFYEGFNSYQNRLNYVRSDEQGVHVRNDNEYPLIDVWFFNWNSSPAFIDTLFPGEGVLQFNEQKDIVSDEMKRVFPDDEILAFKKFWQPVSFDSSDVISSELNEYRKDARFFYRFPRTVIDSLLPLQFSVEPTSISRIIHVVAFPEMKQDTTISNRPYSQSGLENNIYGARGRAQIMRVIRLNTIQLQTIYLMACETKSELSGKLTLKWAIEESGKVIFCTAVSSTMNDREFEAAIVEKVKLFKFGEIDKPVDVTEVVYTFVFTQ